MKTILNIRIDYYECYIIYDIVILIHKQIYLVFPVQFIDYYNYKIKIIYYGT